MTDSALLFAPHSYRLWLTAVEQQRAWHEAAAILQRGILSLCKPVLGQCSHSSGALPGAQATAALDLGLRLLQLLCAAEQPGSHEALLQWASADLGSGGGQSLLLRSKAALLLELHHHPRLLCMLTVCCACAAAHGRLPLAAEHSLGYEQPALAELLRGWPSAPAVEQHRATAAACRASLLAGAGGLGLLPSPGVLQVERGLSQEQRARGQAIAALAAQHQPSAMLMAQCGMLLAVLRLDSFAAPSSSLLADIVGVTAISGFTLPPACLAVLTAAQQQWQASARASVSPSAELVVLLQEAVVVAAAAAAEHSNPVLLACLHGRLHPAAATALVAAVAGSRTARAATAAGHLLAFWAMAYNDAVSPCIIEHAAALCFPCCLLSPCLVTFSAISACRMRGKCGRHRCHCTPCCSPAAHRQLWR